MKKTDKDSRNRANQSNDILTYILLLLLVILLVVVGIWGWNQWQKKPDEPFYDYKSELGEFKVTPSALEIGQLLSDNRSRLKTVERFLADRMRGRKLTASEKEEVRKELVDVNFQKIEEIVHGLELDKLEKDDPVLATIYSQLYEQGKALTRAKVKTQVDRNHEEVMKQWKVIQPGWGISSDEEKKIKEKMNEWITSWYNQAMEKVLDPQTEVKLTEYIVPLWVEGRKIEGEYSRADIDHFRKEHKLKDEKGEISYVDLRLPLDLQFLGYTGFLDPDDFPKSKEGTETFGVTFSTREMFIGEPNYDQATVNENNRRWIEIKLKKELFFNRLGYEEWISKVQTTAEGQNRTYHDICFEQVIETIAHELAHAVVSSIKGEYEGEEKGGHGKLFYKFMQKIEKMMRETPEFSQFEEWWDLTKQNK